MIIDGRAIAKEILARAKTRATSFACPPHVLAIVASETPATLSYMKVKARAAEQAGCVFEVLKVSAEELNILMINRSAQDKNAVIIQLPLPAGSNAHELCNAIPLEKDADVLSSAARALFESRDIVSPYLLPPVVAAIREIFMRHAVHPEGKNAVVIGQGWLVGEPTATWLRTQGANVTTVTKDQDKYQGLTLMKDADIIVSGAGVPKLIKPEILKQGVVLIDAATSESDGTLAGDADPACAEKCSLFTPVPGGLGPIAVACLFENVITLAEQK